MEGKKMSKSLGNILPLRKVIKEHGADIIRFAVVSNSDLMQATNFNKELVEGIKKKLSYFEEVIKKAEKSGNGIAEKWIRASLAKKISNIRIYLEEVNLREIAKELFYDFYHDLRFYEAIKNGNFEIKDVMLDWLTVISPFFPIFSEKFEKKEKIDFDYYNNFDAALIVSMDVVRNLHSEMAEYLQKTKIQKEEIENIKVIVPAQWKYEFYKKIKEKKKLNLVVSEMQEYKEEIEKIAKRLGNKLYALPNLDLPDRKLFIECLNVTKHLFPANVIIEEEEQSKEEKAELSLPLKVVFVINKK
jgi:leucyl-tRNA synthetase